VGQHLLNALINSYVFWIALILGLLTLYILPSLIGAIRGVGGLGWIVVINLLSAGVGWPAALLAALTQPPRYPPPTPRLARAPAGEPARHWPAVAAAFPGDGPAVGAGARVISGARYRVVQPAGAELGSGARRR
jgi:hypothetical protein